MADADEDYRPLLVEWLELQVVNFFVDTVFGSVSFLGTITGTIVSQAIYTSLAGAVADNLWKVFSFAYGMMFTILNYWYLLQLRVYLKNKPMDYKWKILDFFKVIMVSISEVIQDNFQF